MSYDAFDVAMAIDWLKARMDAIRNLKSTDRFNNQIRAPETKEEVCICEGIGMLADILGQQLQRNNKGIYFTYDGLRVAQYFPEQQSFQGGFTSCEVDWCVYYRDHMCGKECISVEPKSSREFRAGERAVYPVCCDCREPEEE